MTCRCAELIETADVLFRHDEKMERGVFIRIVVLSNGPMISLKLYRVIVVFFEVFRTESACPIFLQLVHLGDLFRCTGGVEVIVSHSSYAATGIPFIPGWGL